MGHQIKVANKAYLIPGWILVLLLLLISHSHTYAYVVKLKIDSRDTILSKSGTAYEVLKGTVYFEINPENTNNLTIRDIEYATVNDRGMIEFSSEFELHYPLDVSHNNGNLIFFVANRGRKVGAGFFSVFLDYNWIYEKGYAYMWCGWNADVPVDENKLNIFLPIAKDKGNTITGRVYSEIISFYNDTVFSMPIVWGNSVAPMPANLEEPAAFLTKRKYREDEPIEIPRENWKFAKMTDGKPMSDSTHIYINEGFTPGWLYDLVYTAKDPKISGLGMAAIRDLVSFFKYETSDDYGYPNPLYRSIDHALAWGHSQSGRLLNHFVHENFNIDEKGRKVFNGVMCNCPGAGIGLFNSRFAQTTRHGSHNEDKLYPIDVFPFASVDQYDSITHSKASAFDRARSCASMPKMIYLNSSTDYWTRAASLLHTNTAGTRDLAIADEVRIYMVAGISHTDNAMAIPSRALLTALNEWVGKGTLPPDSRVPMIADGSLVGFDEWRNSFPPIPEITMPDSYYRPLALELGERWKDDGIADMVPPKIIGWYESLVPQVGDDGNDLAGIKLPEIEAPLATYTGWSMRRPNFSNSLKRNSGARWPLPYGPGEKNNNDPRGSIYEYYDTGDDYLNQYTRSLQKLRKDRFILVEDYKRLHEKAVKRSKLIRTLIPIDKLALQQGSDSAFQYFIKLHEADLAWLTFWGSPTELRNRLNTMGYGYLTDNDLDSALQLLRLNTMIFSDFSYGWDKLGECYYKMNEPELALQNYRKSLELDPNNKNARSMIERINEEIAYEKPIEK